MKKSFSPRKVIASYFGILLLLASSFMAFYPSHVLAANITFAWKDARDIAVTGDWSGNLAEVGLDNTQGTTAFGGTLNGGGNSCVLNASVSLSNNTIFISNSGGIGQPGVTYCTASMLGLGTSTGGATVQIQGSRPTSAGPETTAQQTVDFQVDSPKSVADSPDGLTLTIKNSSGQTVKPSLALSKEVTTYYYNGDQNYPAVKVVDYTGSTQLAPGTYTACPNTLVGCKTFTKVKYQPLTADQTVEWGDSYANRAVYVSVKLNDIPWNNTNDPLTVGPIDLTLYDSGGKQVASSKTNTDTLQWQDVCQAWGGCDGGTAHAGNDTLYGALLGIAPGKYKICLGSGTSTCNDVTVGNNSPGAATMSLNSGQSAQYAADAGSGSNDPGCESNGGVLSWIMCPIVEGLAKAIDGIYDTFIQPLLVTKPIKLSGNDPSHIMAIWSNFRIFGDIFLVIALLVVVFGESIGGGLIDAYSAKKILPRLLIAAVAINLSIYVIALAVDITNILGNGIAQLLTKPFSDVPQGFTLKMNGVASGIGLTAIVGSIFYAAVTLGPLLEFLLAFFLLPAFLLFIAIMVTVILRRGLIVLLVLLSPVAFALYCLPNTEKYFKQWWDLLLKTLLIYPIIAVLFALAKILAVTIDDGTQGSGLTPAIAQLLAVISLVVPLFLIPFSFKIAGGILGRAHELLTNASKRGHQAMLGNPNDPSSWRNRARKRLGARNAELNVSREGLQTTFNPRFLRRGGWSARREALGDHRAAARNANGQAILEGSQIWQDNKEDSKFLLAHADEQLARSRMAAASTPEEAEQWRRAIGQAALVPKNQATRMASAQAWLASGYDLNPNGQTAYNEMAETIADITGAGLTRDASNNIIGFSGPNAGAAVGAMNKAQAAMARNGQFHLAGINYGTGYDPDMGLGKADPYTWGRSKPGSANGAKESALSHIAKGSYDDLKKASVYKQELRAIAQSATGSQRDEALKAYNELSANATLDAWEKTAVTGTGGTPLTKQIREVYDPTAVLRVGIPAWTPTEIARGQRYRTVNMTNRDIAESEARTSRIPREDET